MESETFLLPEVASDLSFVNHTYVLFNSVSSKFPYRCAAKLSKVLSSIPLPYYLGLFIQIPPNPDISMFISICQRDMRRSNLPPQ